MDLAVIFEQMEKDFRAGLPADPEPGTHHFMPEEDAETSIAWWEQDTEPRIAINKFETEGIYGGEI